MAQCFGACSEFASNAPMMQEAQFVSASAMERGVAALEALPGEARRGFFGPGSITWTVNRESAVFLGAGRAALLQLAHPWVAASLAQHSNLMQDAIGRFHSTFRVIYTMLFGTRAQAVAAARQLYRRHASIRGELPQAVVSHAAHEHYEANELRALTWVYATLVDSAVLAYEFVRPALTAEQRETYFRESKRMGLLFGISPEFLPADWCAFIRYFEEMVASDELDVSETARALGVSVMSGVGTWVRPPRWYHALTAAWMPERLRGGFGLAYGPSEQQAARRAQTWLPTVYARLPEAVRYVGPYHEAIARLRDREPGWLARRSNRFWMGRERLLYPDIDEAD